LRCNGICKSHTAKDSCGKAQIPQEKKKANEKKSQEKKKIEKTYPHGNKSKYKEKTNPRKEKELHVCVEVSACMAGGDEEGEHVCTRKRLADMHTCRV